MLLGKFLCVLEQITLDEVGSEVADIVAADTGLNKCEFLKVTALGNALLPKIVEECI